MGIANFVKKQFDKNLKRMIKNKLRSICQVMKELIKGWLGIKLG